MKNHWSCRGEAEKRMLIRIDSIRGVDSIQTFFFKFQIHLHLFPLSIYPVEPVDLANHRI